MQRKKILYGIEGEGYGHATRSKAIIEQLSKDYDILIAASNKAYNLLKDEYKTIKIKNFPVTYSYSKDKIVVRVNTFKTIIYNIIRSPYVLWYNIKLIREANRFQPDIIITDYEAFTAWYALFFRKKIVVVDNFHLFTDTPINRKLSLMDKVISIILTKFKIPSADYYLIPTFLPPLMTGCLQRHDNKNVIFCSPMIRDRFKPLKPQIKDYVIVYQTANFEPVINVIKSIKNQRFIIYNVPNIDYNKEGKKNKNITYKKFSEKEFAQDLAGAKAVIINGGFSLITEALYFKKPVLCFPILDHFEQKINALLVKEAGYGECAYKFDEGVIMQFIEKLDVYRERLNKYDSKAYKNPVLLIKKIIDPG
ncbi:hypothetical protein J4206_01815 [Candidatus Woesearchaeota archaeon]|nr:hypothetical protein [Candidatus Woesearchaeota archaeon]